MPTLPRLLWLPVALLACLAAPRGGWAQSTHRTSPILCFLQARYPRDPNTYPAKERLAAYRFYWIRSVSGTKIGDLTPMGPGEWPVFRVVGQDGTSTGSLHLTRPQRSGFVVRNNHLRPIGRILRMNAQAGEYDWRNQADEPIGTLLPVNGSLYYEVRGGDELRALFVETWKVPLDEPARARFRTLYQAVEE